MTVTAPPSAPTFQPKILPVDFDHVLRTGLNPDPQLILELIREFFAQARVGTLRVIGPTGREHALTQHQFEAAANNSSVTGNLDSIIQAIMEPPVNSSIPKLGDTTRNHLRGEPHI
jgi:hypothetical protein